MRKEIGVNETNAVATEFDGGFSDRCYSSHLIQPSQSVRNLLLLKRQTTATCKLEIDSLNILDLSA